MLFDMPSKEGIASKLSSPSSRNKIPSVLIQQLTSQDISIPVTFEISGSLFQIRFLKKADLGVVVRMCVKEFGSYTPTPSIEKQETGTFDINTPINNVSVESKSMGSLPPSIQKAIDNFFTMYENFIFAFVVQLGLDQRIDRCEKGEDPTQSIPSDHNVLCLVEVHQDENTNEVKEEILGISEVSVQPLIPTRTAPPFILSLQMKRLIGQFDANSASSKPVAYVSNVLVKETKRGMGYGKLLMAASEGRAKAMGYDQLFLHVDANQAGSKAQSLYWGLGFESYSEEKEGEESPFAWMGEEFVQRNKGLYLVDGAPLLYLKKDLELDKAVAI